MTNTIDARGDAVVFKEIIEKTIQEFCDDKVTLINTYSFYKCSNLRKLDLPNVTRIGNRAMYYDNKLTEINVPNLKTLDAEVFQYCSGLTGAGNFPSLETIGNAAFDGVKLTSICLPRVKTIGQNVFRNAYTIQTYIIGIENETVCTLSQNSISSTATIYVPDALVDAYKAATNWSSHASYIKPYSEYTGV